MKRRFAVMKKSLSCILCMVLIVAMALVTGGCNGKTDRQASDTAETSRERQVLGEGSTRFGLTVVDAEGNETEFEIHTDQATVGGALTQLGLLEGEEGPHGLYVKAVNGITADYEKDGVYWAFYINGEYAQSGVDSIEITEGDSYSFKVE
ncbi:MAG: DUF4430 domain-containing protein [Lachnospiraceae bacterium]|nr:DUF4430 domain-containing protein [Lachnospiraceae bacterium]